jgi:hypothetical protein
MNKAIIFSGHFRTFQKISKSYDFTGFDIFFHTYDQLGYWSRTESVKSNCDPVTNEMILSLFDNQNIVDIVIEKENSKINQVNELANLMEKRKLWNARPFNFISMHLKRLSAIERFFEKKTKNYDVVFLLRPDIDFTGFNSIDMDKIKNGEIYIENKIVVNNKDFLSDIFLISNEDNLKKLKDIYVESFYKYIDYFKVKNIYKYVDNFKGDYDPHTYFDYLITNYFPIYHLTNNGGISCIHNTKGGYCVS